MVIRLWVRETFRGQLTSPLQLPGYLHREQAAQYDAKHQPGAQLFAP
jgi:hypothetical protein